MGNLSSLSVSPPTQVWTPGLGFYTVLSGLCSYLLEVWTGAFLCLGLVLNSMKNGLSAAECKTKVMEELRLKLPELFG